MATVTSHEEHPVVRSLIYAEELRKDEMEEDDDVSIVYSSSLQVAAGLKLTSGTITQE